MSYKVLALKLKKILFATKTPSLKIGINSINCLYFGGI